VFGKTGFMKLKIPLQQAAGNALAIAVQENPL
jgi:hypothetical protein